MLIKKGKYDFLIGASWHMSQDKSDLKELMLSHEGKARVMLMANEAAWVGFDAECKKPAIAAALAFAAVFPDLLIVEHLSEDRVWLCAINKGMPAPGRDLIVESKEARPILLDWIGYFPSAAIYGDVEGASGSAETAWLRVVEAIRTKEISSKQLRNFRFRRVLSKVDLLKIVAAVVLIAGLGGGGWYMVFSSNEAETAAQRTAREAQEAREREIARLVEEHKTQLIAMRAEVDQMKGRDSLRSWLNFFARQPYVLRGYRPALVTCTAVPVVSQPGLGKNPCEVEWVVGESLGLRVTDRFLLDQTSNDVPTAPLQGSQIQPQAGPLEDFVRRVRHSVDDLPADVSYAPAGTETSVERIRAELMDAVRQATAQTMEVSVSVTTPMVVPGVPDAQIPNVTVAHKGNLTVSANGSRALFDVLHANRSLLVKAAGMGVFVKWASVKVHSTRNSDSVSASADFIVPEPR